MDLTKKYNRKDFVNFLRNEFLPEDFEINEEEIPVEKSWKKFIGVTELGKSDELDLTVFEIAHDSVNDPRVTLTRDSFDMLKKYSSTRNALVAYFCEHDSKWRFSFITFSVRKNEKGKLERDNSNPRRYSFLLGEGCKRHTPETMLFAKGRVTSIEDLQKRFAIEVVTKEFYAELFNWYEWACKLCKFPVGKGRNVSMAQDDNATHIIRLITRLMFVWFIKQKDLIPDWVFDRGELDKILVNFKPASDTSGNYYNAVLQNLFFATLNKEIGERKFAENSDEKYKEDYGIKSFYRDDIKKSFFKISTNEVVKKFEGVPFLNGGLFECLDKFDEDIKNKNVQKYIDGFSRESGRRALVPNCLFWDEEKGLVAILSRYNFTVEENTPLDVDIALDPELLGKVFENLLGTYNPETKETARKESGSFYTPREIVAYMVDESLKAYISNEQLAIDDETLDVLFSDSDELLSLSQKQKMQISHALKNVKVFDPACGSGAFPMGMLQRIMSLLRKLGVDDLGTNENAYSTKLHIIENCLYGSDIQTIAVQIAKLRFFITLICEQEKTFDKNNNYGFHALPNLETKFVAANTLIGLSQQDNSEKLFEDAEIPKIKAELAKVRQKHFSVKTASEKKSYRQKDQELRKALSRLLAKNQVCTAKDAEQLAAWNPYDQNTASEFFDAEWMFGVDGGFDIVIGNPPYISTKDVSADDKKRYEIFFGFSDDTYNLFTFRGLSLVKNAGTLNYIIPKTFWTTQTKRNMRDLILGKNIKYIFDTANPFESAMVDTCIMQVENSNFSKKNKILFLDGSKNLKVPDNLGFIEQEKYLNTQNAVIFKPTEHNLKVWNIYGEKVKELYNTWWDKICTSKKISQNANALEQYRKNLKPGDIALLGCLTEGGQGLATANNGKYIAVRKSTKWAKNIIESRPKKLAEAMKKNKALAKEIGDVDAITFLSDKTEVKIAKLFDDLKEKYGRDIFGQGYIYRLIDDTEIADVDSLTDDEKENGISHEKKFYVPYDKGDKDGNRWYLETPFAIAWSKENVHFLKTDPKARYQGYSFFFREGFCWNNVLNPMAKLLKSKMKSASVNDVGSMSLSSNTSLVPNYYLVSILNSELLFTYYREFINCTVNIQINDIRQIPVIIPSKNQLQYLEPLFKNAVLLKKTVALGEKTESDISVELDRIEEKINSFINTLYGI